MNIAEAAAASGLPVKTLRHYEDLGLVVPLRNSANAYREFSQSDLQRLVFLRLCRDSGVGLVKAAQLLELLGLSELSRGQMEVIEATLQHIEVQASSIASLKRQLLGVKARALGEASELTAEDKLAAAMPFFLLER